MSSKINTAKKNELLSKALDALYSLEDLTGYGNKNVGTAINLLQKEVPKTWEFKTAPSPIPVGKSSGE